MFRARVVVAALCVLGFVVWCVSLIHDVSRLRGEVAERVHWMQVIRAVEQSDPHVPPAERRAALAALDAELPALVAASRDDATLRAALEEATRGLSQLEQRRLESPTLRVEGLAGLVPALREQTRARSAELGEHWDSLNALVMLAIAFASATLVLYVRSHRIRARQLEDDAVRLHAQLLRSDRLSALGTLAATVAHEINNPLSFVLSNLEVLEDRLQRSPDLDTELETSLGQAREGVRRVATIVRDLRSMSHPGRTPATQRVDVHRSLETAMRICEGEARNRARLVREFGRVPRVFAGDAQLGQVFLNLLVNAIQAIDPGKPQHNTVTVRTQTVPEGVSIEIADTGRGIDPRQVDRLFEPFVTTKDVGEGTGLGLYVCRSIVESLHGRILLAPRADGGTTATVILPIAPATEDVGERSVPIHDPTPTEDQHLRILIVDDEEMLASALARSLRGHEAHTANRGKQAVDMASDSHFDLILCDLIMPEMSGKEVFEALHATNPSVKRRFVFMTGATVTSEARAFAESIEAPVLEKPFSRAELLTVIERFL